MTKVLLVEDDPAVAEPLTRALGREGYEVSTQTTGDAALQQVGSCDTVILGLGLPDMDSLDVARTICARGITIPILILTTHTREVDIVIGLDSGAGDYVTKPFRLGKLLARVRALLWCAGGEVTEDEIIECQGMRVEAVTHRAFRGERGLQLTVKEFDLLRVLIHNAGSVVPCEQVMREVWGFDPSDSTKTLDMHASWLWRKLGDDANSPRYITTMHGIGFHFESI